MREDAELIDPLGAVVGRQHVFTADDDQEPYLVDSRGRYHGRAVAVARPAGAEQVASVVRPCAEQQVRVVPWDGNTGRCGAATPPPAEGRSVVLRLDRVNRIRAFSPLANSIALEAGRILADIQAGAEEVDRLFPLSLGAEGRCQIGGNIATNAGGHDPKQLFIGAEGTLGVVMAAALELFPRPPVSAPPMVALLEVEAALALLERLRTAVRDRPPRQPRNHVARADRGDR